MNTIRACKYGWLRFNFYLIGVLYPIDKNVLAISTLKFLSFHCDNIAKTEYQKDRLVSIKK